MAKGRKKKVFDEKAQRQWIIQKLRRISLQWPPSYEAVRKARVAPNAHRCAGCQKLFKSDEIRRDHIHPVVDPRTSFTDWNSYVPSLFCQLDNYQILCKPCHDEKTKKENEERKAG
jgi:5-methylcytosine-specific restriction endonuclease McrA